MQEVIDYWNKQHSLYTMEYERRSYYKDGHDNDLWIIRIKKDNTIIKEFPEKIYYLAMLFGTDAQKEKLSHYFKLERI